jgi:hypothetical protein
MAQIVLWMLLGARWAGWIKKAEMGAVEKIGGVRIPRRLSAHKFWDVMEQYTKAADEKSGGQV